MKSSLELLNDDLRDLTRRIEAEITKPQECPHCRFFFERKSELTHRDLTRAKGDLDIQLFAKGA